MISSEENKHINVPSTSKVNTLSQDLLFQRHGNTVPRKENKYPDCVLALKDKTFKSKIETLKSKISP